MKKTVIFIMLVTLLLSACDTEEPGASASIEPTPTTAVPPTAEPTEEPAAEPTAVEVVEAESDVLQPYYEPLSPDECFATPPEDVEMAVEYDCGYIVVPEFYSGETTQSVKIPFIRFNSGQGTAVSPVLVHPGGPGQSQLNESFFSEFNIMFDEVIPDRDVIFMDPRGTDHAVPFLDCPAAYALDWQVFEQGLDDEAATALFRETFQQCIDDFKAQGVNLDAYNSLELAGDVNSVTQALGYEQIIYFGTSYGAQLGQHIMRDYPEILESIILNGSAPLSRQSWIEDRALDNQEALDNLVALCASEENAGCIEAYPDTPGQLDALLDNFADPISYTYTDPNDPSLTINVEVTESDIAGLIHGLMGNKNAITSLPWIIDSWSQPDQIDGLIEASGSQAAQAIITSRDLTKGDMAFLMHLAVVCSDDPVESADDIILNGVSDFAALAASPMAELYVNGCGRVNVRSLPDETDENVTVDIPTLLLSGGLDVSTPFVRSQLVADALPNATHVIFPGHTHDQLGGLSSCVEEVFTQFIADPEAELDTTCLATPDYLGFQLPDGSFTHDFEEEDAQVVPDDEQPMMAESTLSEEITDQLDAYLQSQVYTDGGSPRGAAPGLVLYVETPDGVYLNAAGVSNLEDGTPMQTTDILEIGSNTKSMTIVLLMQLVEEGLISLDDPLSQYLPDQAALLPNGDQVTIRQMAQHTAGFYDYADSIIAAGLTDPAALEAGFAPAEMVQAAVD